jgi:hypothetical protein
MAEKLVTQSQGELMGVLTALLGLVAASGQISLTQEQIGAIVAFLGILACIIRYGSDGAKLVLSKSKIAQDLEQGQFPCIADVQTDFNLATVEVDKIKDSVIALGLSPSQVQTMLSSMGMDQAQIGEVLKLMQTS